MARHQITCHNKDCEAVLGREMEERDFPKEVVCSFCGHTSPFYTKEKRKDKEDNANAETELQNDSAKVSAEKETAGTHNEGPVKKKRGRKPKPR